MDSKSYIRRISYKGDLTPNIRVLKDLQQTHLLNVPFENLDIHYGIPIDLDIDKIYHKVVVKRRGGFCYELNGLFYTLLKDIGFDSTMISARVYDSKKESFGKEYDHLAIIVKLDTREYLVDVGFGEFVFHPLKLEMDRVQSDPRGNFVIEEYKDEYYKVSKIEGETRSIEYIFTKKERALHEFAEMCNYHQTSPCSHFTQKSLISRPTQKGRITITGNTLKITKGSVPTKEHQFAKEEYGKQLLDWFTIEESTIKVHL